MYWLLSKIMPPAHVLIAENLHHTCPASPHCASEVELLLGTPQNWQSVGCKFPASSLQASAATHHKTRQQLRKLNFLGLTVIWNPEMWLTGLHWRHGRRELHPCSGGPAGHQTALLSEWIQLLQQTKLSNTARAHQWKPAPLEVAGQGLPCLRQDGVGRGRVTFRVTKLGSWMSYSPQLTTDLLIILMEQFQVCHKLFTSTYM